MQRYGQKTSKMFSPISDPPYGQKTSKMFSPISDPPQIFFKNQALSLLYPYGALTSCKTRQVYNGPRTLNLSQQQQQKFWSKMIFCQQNQRNFTENLFFSENNLGKNKIWEKYFWKKNFLERIWKNFFKKNFEIFFNLK